MLLDELLLREVLELLVELLLDRLVLEREVVELLPLVEVTPGVVVVVEVVDVVEIRLVVVVEGRVVVVGNPGLLPGGGGEESSPPHAVNATLANAPIGVKRASSHTPRNTTRRAVTATSCVASSMAGTMTSTSRVILCNSKLVVTPLPS